MENLHAYLQSEVMQSEVMKGNGARNAHHCTHMHGSWPVKPLAVQVCLLVG
jgi:hypothetical protein